MRHGDGAVIFSACAMRFAREEAAVWAGVQCDEHSRFNCKQPLVLVKHYYELFPLPNESAGELFRRQLPILRERFATATCAGSSFGSTGTRELADIFCRVVCLSNLLFYRFGSRTGSSSDNVRTSWKFGFRNRLHLDGDERPSCCWTFACFFLFRIWNRVMWLQFLSFFPRVHRFFDRNAARLVFLSRTA
jgi:hypothetical protein